MARDVLEHELIARVMAAPVEHLGVRATRTLSAFLRGYENAMLHHGVGRLVSSVPFHPFCNWFKDQLTFRAGHADQHSGFGPESIALLLAEDDREALDVYVAARERYRTEVAPHVPVEEPFERGEVMGLVSGIMSNRARPWHRDIAELWAEINGFTIAERDQGTPSLEVAHLVRFGAWLRARYPFADGSPWLRIFRILSLGNPRLDIEQFYAHFDRFLASESASVVDPATAVMIENLVAHVKRLETPSRVTVLAGKNLTQTFFDTRWVLEPLGFTIGMQEWVSADTHVIVMEVDDVAFARGMLDAIDSYKHVPIIFLCRNGAPDTVRALLAWPKCRFATSITELRPLIRELDPRFAKPS